MGTKEIKSYIDKYGEIFRGGLLFLFIYLFLCISVDLRLVYHVFGTTDQISGFVCRYGFFHQSLIIPGGMLGYVSTFIEQFYMFRWIGPLFVTAIMCLTAILTARAFKKMAIKGALWAMYCPAVILTACYTGYTHQLEYALALLLSLILLNAYISVGRSSLPVRLALFIFLFLLQFHIALASCFIFALMCAISERVIYGRRKLSLLIVLVSAVLPYLIGVQFFSICTNDAYAGYLPFSWPVLGHGTMSDGMVPVSILYLVMPAWLLLCGVYCKWHAKKGTDSISGRKNGEKKNRSESTAFRKTGLIKWIAVTFLLAVVTYGSIRSARNKSYHRLLNLQLLCSQKRWLDALELSMENPTDMYSINARNRALYHLSRLSEDMFKYPQNIKALILTRTELDNYYWMKADLAISLGLCDVAQEYLVETMVGFADHPEILKKLAYVHMAKNDIRSAMVYLGSLSEMLFYAEWANEYLLKLKDDPSLILEEDIQYTRYCNLSGMEGLITSPYGFCKALLNDGRKNHMAYEYGMAYCLLVGDKGMDEFANYIKDLGDYEYEKIPRSYEQAMLLYNFNPANKNKKIVLDNYEISVEARQEFDAFHKLANSFKTREQARRALAAKYAGTYYYYFYYVSNRY